MAGPTEGRFVWYELLVPDAEAAMRFYSELFDWNVTEVRTTRSSWAGTFER